MILKTISLANMPALTEEELAKRTADWMGVLNGSVPENWLERSCQNAIYEHKGSFPVTCYEVLDGYKRLTSAPPAQKPAEEYKLATTTGGGVCERCYGTNFEHIYNRAGHLIGVSLSRRCDHRAILPGDGLYEKLDADRQHNLRYVHLLPEGVRERLFPNVQV